MRHEQRQKTVDVAYEQLFSLSTRLRARRLDVSAEISDLQVAIGVSGTRSLCVGDEGGEGQISRKPANMILDGARPMPR